MHILYIGRRQLSWLIYEIFESLHICKYKFDIYHKRLVPTELRHNAEVHEILPATHVLHVLQCDVIIQCNFNLHVYPDFLCGNHLLKRLTKVYINTEFWEYYSSHIISLNQLMQKKQKDNTPHMSIMRSLWRFWLRRKRKETYHSKVGSHTENDWCWEKPSSMCR